MPHGGLIPGEVIGRNRDCRLQDHALYGARGGGLGKTSFLHNRGTVCSAGSRPRPSGCAHSHISWPSRYRKIALGCGLKSLTDLADRRSISLSGRTMAGIGSRTKLAEGVRGVAYEGTGPRTSPPRDRQATRGKERLRASTVRLLFPDVPLRVAPADFVALMFRLLLWTPVGAVAALGASMLTLLCLVSHAARRSARIPSLAILNGPMNRPCLKSGNPSAISRSTSELSNSSVASALRVSRARM